MIFETMRHSRLRRPLAAVLTAAMLLGSGSGFGRGRLGGGAAGALGDLAMDPPEQNQVTTGLPDNMVNGFAPAGTTPGDGIAGQGGIPLVQPGDSDVFSQSGEVISQLPGGGGIRTSSLLQPDALPAMRSLKTVGVPAVPGLTRFIRNPAAAIILGKALYWDTQAGSDGNACASCHFHAGADNRMKNQLSPGLAYGDPNFEPTATSGRGLDLFTSPNDQRKQRLKPGNGNSNRPTRSGGGGPNYTLKPDDFPFHVLSDPLDRNSAVLFDSDDVVSSQGAFGGVFRSLGANGTEDCGDRSSPDSFEVHGILTRRVPGRNAPSTINAVFNYRNFWDGRANNVFNGVNPFGPRDPDAKLLELKSDGSIVSTAIALPNASLASQAVGPVLSEFEMSCANRTFKDLGRKLLALQPLRLQDISPGDSVLGAHLSATGRGLKESYPDLVRAAFDPRWWNAPGTYDGYSQMEANFSLFWGLAIMMYESTLVSDETPYDRFVGYPGHPGKLGALTAQQQRGLKVFRGQGQCVSCHKGAEFTGAATNLQPGDDEGTLIESMFLKTGEYAVYDNGFYNIGVRPSAEDRGVGGTDPFGNPLSFSRNWFDLLRQRAVADPVWADPCLFSIFSDVNACWVAPEAYGTRIAADGAFKTPSLRNVALTQPYFHNGSRYTLEQVVEFYNRGGDRRGPDDNDTSGYLAPDAPNGGGTNVHPTIMPLGLTPEQSADLVAFLRGALTDPRVACERAPFDHPSLSLHNGHFRDEYMVRDSNRDQKSSGKRVGKGDDEYLLLPAVGAKGLPSENCLRNDDGSAVAAIGTVAP